MKWFKFYGQDYLSDPKMLALTPSERSCWITLLCYSSVNDDGKISYLSEQQLMMQAGLNFAYEEWDLTAGILKKLENLEMIHIDNGVITIKNWQKRQETNLTGYERIKKYRQKKQNDNAMITLEENRIDNILPASQEIPLKAKKKNMSIRGYDEDRDSASYGKTIDADTGEFVGNKEDKRGSSKKAKELIVWATERRGFNFTSIPKQLLAINKIKTAGKSPEDVKARWMEMEQDPFWAEKGFDFMSVCSSFDRKK